MNRKLSKQLALLFSFLLVFINLSFVQPVVSSAQNLDSAVTITVLENDGNPVIETKAVPIEDGDTAFDVLKEVADDVETKEYSFGPMIMGINDIHSVEGQDFWSFIVNGDFADSGAADYNVKNGDNILFLLTDGNDKLTNVSVSATDAKGKEIIKQTEVTLQPFSTAYDAIVQAAEKNNKTLDVSVHSQLFTFFNNVDDFPKEEGDWWGFYVNGAEASTGVIGYKVQDDDEIKLQLQFSYIEDENNQPEKEEPKPKPEEEKTEDEKDKENNTDNESTTNPNIKTINNQVLKDVQFLTNYVLKEDLATDYGSEWFVWGLAKAGEKVPNSYIKDVEKTVKEKNGEFTAVTDLEKVIIALSTAGYDATNVAGINLIEKLETHPDLTNQGFISNQVYALIALNSGNYSFNEQLENDVINIILNQELDNGGWTYFGNDPSPDITGMVLIGLSKYKDRPEVKKAIDKAVDYLANDKDKNGWFYDQWAGGYSSPSVSQVIMGLVSVGIDPTIEPFIDDNGKDLLSYLLEFKVADGLYKQLKSDEESDPTFSTEQALLALAYYKEFAKIGGSPTTPKPGGTTEGPKDNTSKPTKTEKKPTLTDENNTVQTVENNVKKTTEDGKKLPKTNSNMYNIMGIGLLILAAGFVFLSLQRKWKNQ